LTLRKIETRINFVEQNLVSREVGMTEDPARPDTLAGKFPAWAGALDDQDWQFLRRFLLSSGSLKALADAYGVSYPTVRGRLDRLITKVRAAEDPKVSDPFERKLRILVADAQVPVAVAKELLAAHRDSLKGRTVE
jgi:hypothetical protein